MKPVWCELPPQAHTKQEITSDLLNRHPLLWHWAILWKWHLVDSLMRDTADKSDDTFIDELLSKSGICSKISSGCSQL